MGNLCYVGTQEEVVAANNQIDENCGFPDGYTQTWDTPRQAYQQDFWFILKPPVGGYQEPNRSFTQAQMINGVVNVTEEESQSNWYPPSNKRSKK